MAIPRVSYFVSTESQPRARRARDAVGLILGLVLLLWGVVGIDRLTPLESAVIDLLTALPAWIRTLLAAGWFLGLLYLISILGALIFGGRKRREALVDVVAAGLGAAALTVLMARVMIDAWPYVLPEVGLDDPAPRFPVLRVGLVAATLVAVSPHLSRPMRRFGWWIILVSALAAVALRYGDPSDVIGGLGIGLISAGTVLLIRGSPKGYPDPASIADALTSLGLSVESIHIDPDQSWGVRRLVGTSDDGKPVAIKAYGRDASDSQLISKVGRRLWYREVGRTLGYSRLQAVEHEALVTMLAGRAGVPVPDVLAVGEASPEIALLAVSDRGKALDEFTVADFSDAYLVDVWRDVALLHAASISHGSLATDAIHIDRDGHTLVDFALGSVAASEADRQLDIVEFLFSLGTLIGVERAVSTAISGLGAAELAAALPYLQLPAVSSRTRHRAERPKSFISQLQAAVVKGTGHPLPDPVKLRRVSGRNLVTAGLLLLAAWALIPLFTGVDYAAVWEVIQDADWPMMILALVVGQSMFLPQATATMFAVPRALPFWPLVSLQAASQFVSLAIPSAAGRVAMNAAFLHKFGVALTVAVAQGAIDGFSGFLVQAAILVIAFFTSDVQIQTSNVDISWGVILVIAAVLVAGVVATVLRVRRLRDRVVPIVKQGWEALMTVLRQPSRAFGLLGSNFVYWNVLGLTLWLLLDAIGVPIDYGAALVVTTATNLLGGFVPVPGGVGVSEAVMTALLVALGIDQSVAFAAAVSYRLITFYLPALEGFFAMRWLERNEYL